MRHGLRRYLHLTSPSSLGVRRLSESRYGAWYEPPTGIVGARVAKHAKKPKKSRRVGQMGAGYTLSKYLSHAGHCSRKEADELWKTGSISVNDEQVEAAYRLKSDDVVRIDDSVIVLPSKPRIWLYFKPKREIVSTVSDTGKKKDGLLSMYQSIKRNYPTMKGHFVGVGRLDAYSEGLMLLTNCPSLAHVLEIRKNRFERVYRVRAHGMLYADKLNLIRRGIKVKGIRYRPMKVKLVNTTGTNVWLELVLTEGRNHEIRIVFEAIGLKVTRLIRTEFGPYKLLDMVKGELRDGTIPKEVQTLLDKKMMNNE